jgi:membrane protease YdiL (CAAX protease family)
MGMTEPLSAPGPDAGGLVPPVWLIIALAVCLPATVIGLWRLARWWLSGRPMPLPDGRAMPASRILMPFGLFLFGAMFLATYLLFIAYMEMAKYGLPPSRGKGEIDTFDPLVFAAQIVPPLLGLVVVLRLGRGVAGSIGLRLGSVWRAVKVGVAGLAFVLPLCVAGLILTTLVFWVLHLPTEQHPLLEELLKPEKHTTRILVLSLVQAAVLAALAEEFMYRGVLMMSLLKYVSPGWAIAVSSGLWAIVHLQGEPQAVGALFLLGLALGYMAYRTRSLLAPVLAHGLFNAVMILGRYYGS